MKNISENLQQLRDIVAKFPTVSGCYYMLCHDGTIIYVGKAKNIKNRVRSYLRTDLEGKTKILMKHVVAIEYTITATEYDALILENRLIKKHLPKYNIMLRDDKTYPLLRLSAEVFSRLDKVRAIGRDSAHYYGPFANVGFLNTYIEYIDRTFLLRKCKGHLPHRAAPCLYYHMKQCAAPCVGAISADDYAHEVARVRAFLDGAIDEHVAQLHTKIVEHATHLRFEEAARLRDEQAAILAIHKKQDVEDFNMHARDYIAWSITHELCTFVVMHMREGKMADVRVYPSYIYDDDEGAVVLQFVVQYYSVVRSYPQQLYFGAFMSDEVQQQQVYELAREFFARECAVAVKVMQRHTKHDARIIAMAYENAQQNIQTRVHNESNVAGVEALQQLLQLDNAPLVIECFDIAHLQGKHTVAAMVQFREGVPYTQEYRRYHIHSTEGVIDDFMAMREVSARRYTRLLNEKKALPDLILIDGGKGQLHAVHDIIRGLGMDTSVVSLAKKREELYVVHNSHPIIAAKTHKGLQLCIALRDEAHRFATTFNQQLRSKNTLKLSVLETVKGIGPKKSVVLLSHFGSIEAIQEAAITDIMRVAKISHALAQAIQVVCSTSNYEH